MKKENVVFLNKLIKTLQENSLQLEKAYKNKDTENFNKIKNSMAEIQKQIDSILK